MFSKMYRFFLTLIFTLLMTGSPEALDSNATPLQQLYVMKELVPNLQTVGLIWKQSSVNSGELLPKIQRAAAATSVKVVIADAEELREIAEKFRDLTDNYRIQALWIITNDDLTGSSLGQDFLIKNSVIKGIPIFAPSTDWVSKGACATLLNEGGSVKLFVNKKTADVLKIKIPEKYMATTQFLATN